MDDVLEVLLFHIIAFFALSLALTTVLVCISINAGATSTPVELPLPEQLEVGDTSDGCGATDADEPPAYAQDEGGERLVLPPLPGVAQNTGGSNSERPHQQSSTLLPMYMDGSDRRIVLLPTVRSHRGRDRTNC
jgi:hypothetical protein